MFNLTNQKSKNTYCGYCFFQQKKGEWCMFRVIKKDKSFEDFDISKVIAAVQKSAARVMVKFDDNQIAQLVERVQNHINGLGYEDIDIKQMHSIVEESLESLFPIVAKSYRDYRNYKVDFVSMLDEVYKKSQSIMYIGDKENSNADSSIVSTKRSLVYSELNKELYKKFFLNQSEIQAIRDGFIYVHDMSSRRDSINCCLFNIKNVLKGGFELGNIWYNEPKTLDTAFDVIGDIVLSAASQQYGGFTMSEMDSLLEEYAQRSYDFYEKKYEGLGVQKELCKTQAMADVQRDMEQGFQGWEYKFNTVASSRGDYPFITMTFGLATSHFGKMAAKAILTTRANGQGKKGFKKPVLFPKLVFLYDKNLHAEGKQCHDVFLQGIECSSKTMYPDYLSLTGDGYVADIYKKYGKAISPMGCRAFLSPWFERGGAKPADEKDTPVFLGRFNIGAISLHLPMIYAKSQRDGISFHECLDVYMEMIRNLHKRTYDYIGQMRASVNPLAFCEGGLLGGNLKHTDKIAPILKTATASFGVTALAELQQLFNGKSLVEDGAFALETMKYINKKVDEYKQQDGNLYAIYGTPAESLCGLQIKQFRQMFGIINNVSNREYVSNSFHCHVTEEIDGIQKQDLENRFWNLFNGGKIQYVKYDLSYNKEAIKTMVERAMGLGFYEGVNLSLSYCNECGHSGMSEDCCKICGSHNLTKIERMNGYLSYTRVNGDTRLNEAKMQEIAERKSM